jgi:hypothetical protein
MPNINFAVQEKSAGQVERDAEVWSQPWLSGMLSSTKLNDNKLGLQKAGNESTRLPLVGRLFHRQLVSPLVSQS